MTNSKIIIASRNPVKLAATKEAFESTFPDYSFTFLTVNVPSEVSNQPMDDQETLLGACNRVKNAKLEVPNADFWVGIEGGIEWQNGKVFAFAWVAVSSLDQKGESRTASFQLPVKVTELISSGMELGEADDKVFGKHDSKRKQGAVGLLTNNRIDRKALYAPAVELALIPFSNSSLYASTNHL